MITMHQLKHCLSVAIENLFEPGKELSEDEFEKLATELFDLDAHGIDAGAFLTTFLEKPDIAARLRSRQDFEAVVTSNK